MNYTLAHLLPVYLSPMVPVTNHGTVFCDIAFGAGLSEFANVNSGVTQGSILEPTLFLLFINDLPLFFKHCFSDFFADDATLHTHSKSESVIEKKYTNLFQ